MSNTSPLCCNSRPITKRGNYIILSSCMARQCSPLRRKFMQRSIVNPALSLLMKHLLIGQRQKVPNSSAFHWSPHGSLVSIREHFVLMSVVHLSKRTETSLITESDQSGPNRQLLQLCTALTAWSDSDQAVRAVHCCSSWLAHIVCCFPLLLKYDMIPK